jgi:hypothetical protein
MLTGSLAMNYYAQPRMTRDIDMVVEIHAGQASVVARLFGPEYYVSEEAIAEAISRQSLFNVIHLESAIKVDFIVRKASDYRRQEFDRRLLVSIAQIPVWVASKEDLILSKLCWAKDSHSDLQCRDVRNLLSTGCDLSYVERWAGQLGVLELFRELHT